MKTFALVLSAMCALNSIVDAGQKLEIVVEHSIDDCEYRAQNGDRLYTYYTGTFKDGTEFDSNVGSPTPYTYVLGARHVIKGMDQGTVGMCVGEKRLLVIPSELAYGEVGYDGVIPPNSILVFEVELVNIVRKDEL